MLILKKGKERPILQRHHWIYSGAVASLSPCEEGDLLPVHSHEGKKLGLALIRKGRSIVGHMLAFGEETIEEALQSRLRTAHVLRRRWVVDQKTNAYRLIHAEADGIPGLIIDSYNDHLVLQISHPGIEKLKELLLKLLITEVKPKAIFEKSTSFMRRKEGLEEVRAHLYGESHSEVQILERGLAYTVDLLEGQKTGFFLDQREMRSLIASLSYNKRVLNCFSYTGAFSISALAGGASHVDSVDSSRTAEGKVKKNLLLNGFEKASHQFFCEDAFAFLRNSSFPYDLVILDPPAFVKKKEDIDEAFRAYKELNRMAMEKMGPATVLLTCSCSYHVGEELFQNILFRAALEAKREVRIIEKHRLAHDHPISLFHPESSYLKSLVLYLT